ncbi:Conserved_hypothetical protein [Hexamita inflata]|uniref:Uncharacterized protein n=1 Tax=Hexamita inflata TaxID=28002 RepID=A0AA86Q3E2_9EUKA|nr:Conserved hypothetical protein [Hexamita inflata]
MNNNNLKWIQRYYSQNRSFQFCDLVYDVTSNVTGNRLILQQVINEANTQVSYKYIKTNIQIDKILLSCSSTIIFLDDKQEIYVFDMVYQKCAKLQQNNKQQTVRKSITQNSSQIQSEEDKILILDQFYKSLELGQTGIKINNEILVKLFGNNYPLDILNYHCKYCQNQEAQHSSRTHEQVSKLQKCQLMHVFKPMLYQNLYIVIEDDSLYVIDKEMNILQQTPIDCDIFSGHVQPMVFEDPIFLRGYLHQMIPCQGNLYIQVQNKVFQLKDTQFKFVFKIPNHKMKNTTCANIFCFHQELYVKTPTVIYVYRNNELQVASQNELKQIFDLIYQPNTEKQYYKWNDNEKYTVDIWEDDIFLGFSFSRSVNILEVKIYHFVNDLIIVKSKYNTVLIDPISKQIFQFKDDVNNLLHHFELNNCGFQYKNQILRKCFNLDIEQLDLEYKQLLSDQMQHQCYLDEINKIIPFSLIIKSKQIKFNEKHNSTINRFQSLSAQIHYQLSHTAQTIQQMAHKQNEIVSIFTFLGGADQ